MKGNSIRSGSGMLNSMPGLKTQKHRLWVCVLINQLAFPGMGTVMAGRRSGYFQALLMVAGFCMVVGFMIWYFICVIRYLMGEPWTEEEYIAQYGSYHWVWQVGLILCVLSWFWALASSLSLLKQSDRDDNQPPSPGPENGKDP